MTFRYRANPRAARQLAESVQMRTYMQSAATTGGREVAQRAPHVEGPPIDGKGEVRMGSHGWEAVVIAESPIWHLPEFGGGHFPSRPYLRPGVQALLSRLGGRWKSHN